MKRIIHFAFDSSDNIHALTQDGVLWVQGTHGWQRIEGIPDDGDPEVPIVAAESVSNEWLPNGAPIWCVDTSDESVVRVPNPAVFVRWHKHAGTAPWKLVETATEREALALAKHPGLGLLTRVIIAGDPYDIISDIIPF